MKKLKVSSIFHTLYACLLLAPVFAVGTACAQIAFHGSQISEVPPKFGFLDDGQKDFKEDIWYVVGDASLDMPKSTFYAKKIDVFMAFGDGASLPTYYSWSYVLKNSFLDLECNTESILTISFEDNYNPNFASQNFITFGNVAENLVFAFRLHDIESIEVVGTHIVWYWETMPEKYLPYMPKDYTEGVGDVFYTSVDKVSASPFFNWAEKSFLGEGFRYAGNIFGMPYDSPFYTFACYWLAISILWLIFDVLIYVPMLAHRWLDRGAIE